MLEVDGNLRVRGCEGSIFALGDCAKITMPSMKAAARTLFDKADVNKDGELSLKEFEAMIQQARKDYPHLEAYLGEASRESMRALYEKADKDGSAGVTPEEFEAALDLVDKEMRMLPPTAQVAAQQGEYLAKILNSVPYKELAHESGFEPHFQYNHMGSMAYIGGEHAAIDSPVFGVSSGLITYVLWKGIYMGKSVSMTMKIGLLFDWAKTWFLGRDTSRL
jgi:NADH dehydrogenase FAD-containing subunit